MSLVVWRGKAVGGIEKWPRVSFQEKILRYLRKMFDQMSLEFQILHECHRRNVSKMKILLHSPAQILDHKKRKEGQNVFRELLFQNLSCAKTFNLLTFGFFLGFGGRRQMQFGGGIVGWKMWCPGTYEIAYKIDFSRIVSMCYPLSVISLERVFRGV